MKYLKITAIVVTVTALAIINLSETFSTKCINASLETLVKMNKAQAEGELGEDGYFDMVPTGTTSTICEVEMQWVFYHCCGDVLEEVEICYEVDDEELECVSGGSDCFI